MPDSFGFVVPAIEQRKIMACTFSSLKYPGRAPEGHMSAARFRWRQSAAGSVSMTTMRRWKETSEPRLASLLGVTAEPLFSRLWRHPQLDAAISRRPSGEN